MKSLLLLIVNVVTMRRLHQTILLATSVIFFILFILYKHEYDRLSNLLRVLNTFGQSSCDGSTNAKGDLLLLANSQSHVWQKVGPLFTYSAVWDLNVVKIFAVLPLTFPLKDVPFTKCLVRHSKREKDLHEQSFSESEMSLETELLDKTELHWRVIYFVCNRVSTSEGIPISVALLHKSNINNYKTNAGDSMPFIPVLRLKTLESRTELSNRSIAICAALSHQNQIETSIINQFIQFHSYIGVNRITLYDFAGSQQSSNIMKANADNSESSNTRIQVLNWNFPREFPSANKKNPSADSVTNMMRRDCAFRHFDHHFVLVLELDQLIVPRFHSHLSRFLQDEEEQDDSIGVAQFTLKTFCSEFKSNPYVKLATDWPAFLKSHWMQATSEEEKERAVILNPRAVRGFNKNGVPELKVGYHRLQVDSEIAAVHQYKVCGGNTSYAHFDNIVPRKFGTHFVPILKLT